MKFKVRSSQHLFIFITEITTRYFRSTREHIFPQSEEYLTVVYARKPILKADNSIVVACEESERLVSLDEHKSNTTESDDETFHTDCEELDRSKLPELEPNLNSDDDTLYTAPKGADPSFYPGKFMSNNLFISRNVDILMN